MSFKQHVKGVNLASQENTINNTIKKKDLNYESIYYQ